MAAGHLLGSSLTEELILTAMLQEEQVDRFKLLHARIRFIIICN